MNGTITGLRINFMDPTWLKSKGMYFYHQVSKRNLSDLIELLFRIISRPFSIF